MQSLHGKIQALRSVSLVEGNETLVRRGGEVPYGDNEPDEMGMRCLAKTGNIARVVVMGDMMRMGLTGR